MRNKYIKILLGLGLGTFFSTEAMRASIPVVESAILRMPATFAPATNNHIIAINKLSFDKNLILNDVENKISPDFKVPAELRERVSFWFDIYTKYTAQEEIIHHADYPWVIYRVVDLKPILDAEGNKWVNYHLSMAHSKKQRSEVRK